MGGKKRFAALFAQKWKKLSKRVMLLQLACCSGSERAAAKCRRRYTCGIQANPKILNSLLGLTAIHENNIPWLDRLPLFLSVQIKVEESLRFFCTVFRPLRQKFTPSVVCMQANVATPNMNLLINNGTSRVCYCHNRPWKWSDVVSLQLWPNWDHFDAV